MSGLVALRPLRIESRAAALGWGETELRSPFTLEPVVGMLRGLAYERAVLIGVEDGARAVQGVSEPLALEERVASLVSDSILPRVLPDIELLAFRNTHVLAVRVHPSAARPHYLTRSGPEEGAYVRVGSTNRRAGPELLAEMRRFARGETFDEQPMPDLTVDAVDFDAAASAFEDVRTLRRTDPGTRRWRRITALTGSRIGGGGSDGRWQG